MAKDVETAAAAKEAAQTAATHAGHIAGLRASAASFEFDVEDKKGRLRTLKLEQAASPLAAVITAAYGTGKKLHIVARPANGAGIETAVELRFGSLPKPPKVKKPKAVKPEVRKPEPAKPEA